MQYYIKIIDGGETCILECSSYDDAVLTRRSFINYNANLIITIETRETI